MKKQLIGLGVALLMFGGVVSAGATLVDNGNGVIFDNVANQYWMQDLSYFTDKTYDEQIDGISVMNQEPFEGGKYWNTTVWENWHMADLLEMTNLWKYTASEIASVFMASRQTGTYILYYGRYNSLMHTSIHYLGILASQEDALIKEELQVQGYYDSDTYSHLGAWVVADATTVPAPEPATMLLFGTGLVGLVGSRIRKKKQQ